MAAALDWVDAELDWVDAELDVVDAELDWVEREVDWVAAELDWVDEAGVDRVAAELDRRATWCFGAVLCVVATADGALDRVSFSVVEALAPCPATAPALTPAVETTVCV